ncbi:rod shape-determining protein MreD [Oscillatoria amoena NRMC-F 0135]|nr:rod shape-determining protein MreD [Oscillatoria amoena NRMC-F 0135]
MTIFALLVGLFLALMIQGSLGPSGLLFGIRPELVVCLVAYAGMQCKLPVIIIFGFLAGISQDALSHNLQGVSAFAYVTAGMMIHSQRNVLFDKGVIPIMLTCAVSTVWTCAASYVLISLLQRGGFVWSLKTSEMILTAAAVNLFVGPFVFLMINLLKKIPMTLGKKRRRRA